MLTNLTDWYYTKFELLLWSFPVVIFCSVSQRSRPSADSKNNARFFRQDHANDSKTWRPSQWRRWPTHQQPAHHDPVLSPASPPSSHPPAPKVNPPSLPLRLVRRHQQWDGFSCSDSTFLRFTSHLLRWWSSLWTMVMQTCAWTSRLLWLHMVPLYKIPLLRVFRPWDERGLQQNTQLTKRSCYIMRRQHFCKGMLLSFFFHLKHTEANVSNSGEWVNEPQQLII